MIPCTTHQIPRVLRQTHAQSVSPTHLYSKTHFAKAKGANQKPTLPQTLSPVVPNPPNPPTGRAPPCMVHIPSLGTRSKQCQVQQSSGSVSNAAPTSQPNTTTACYPSPSALPWRYLGLWELAFGMWASDFAPARPMCMEWAGWLAEAGYIGRFFGLSYRGFLVLCLGWRCSPVDLSFMLVGLLRLSVVSSVYTTYLLLDVHI